MCTACLCRSACLTSGRRMSGARLRARRPRLARRLAAAVHGALLVSVGAVLRLGGRVRELPRPRSVNCLPGGLPRARAELRVRRVHRGRGASGARRRAQGAEQREHLRVGVRPGVLPCRMGLRQLQHAGAGVSARPALARVQRASGRGLHAVPGPASREGLLSSAANKQWAKGDECASECSAGLYNDKTQFAEGRCRHCWDRTELALHAGLEQQFFALFACNATRNALWAPCAQESGAHLTRTVRIRVAAGVLRNQLPAAVAEHARAQQHRRGHLRPLRRGAWEAGRAKTHGHAHPEKIHRETYTFRPSPY